MTKSKTRCQWANSNELFISYHDEEWGVPIHYDQRSRASMLSCEGNYLKYFYGNLKKE